MPYVNGIHTETLKAFEQIDAAIFSSDGLCHLPQLRERITYFVRRWQKELDETSAISDREKPMEHAELLTEARGVADKMRDCDWYPEKAATIRTLADLVESYTNERAARIQEREKRTAVLEDRLDDYLSEQQDARLAGSSKADALTIRGLSTLVAKQKKIIAETSAACVTCEDVILDVIVAIHPTRENADYRKLHAAHDQACQAIRAAKLVDTQRDIDETMAVATGEHDDLLKRLAGIGDTTNQPPDDPPDWDRWHELLDIKAKRVLNPAEYDEYKRLSEIAEHLDAEEGQAAGAALDNLAKRYSKPPPPVEVEMRTHESLSGDGSWTWQCRLGGIWQTMIGTEDALYFGNKGRAQSFASDWLADLRHQLGVELVAVWKDGE